MSEHHYDLGEDLYDLFLDKSSTIFMCILEIKSNESLEDAQQNKINHIIKKLNLKSWPNSFRYWKWLGFNVF